jgi:flagellar L-ring protein precursor FlgH
MFKHAIVALSLTSIGPWSTLQGQEGIHRSLFADEKARRVGDIITILILESSSATNDAKSSATRESDVSLAASGTVNSKALPGGSVSIGTGNKFSGEGATSTRGSIRARISARVDSVTSNGNLLISGVKTISINGEDQIIKIIGVVRPSDIQADNTVNSYNIADATVVFEGSGMIDRAQGPGWLTKLFHWLF